MSTYLHLTLSFYGSSFPPAEIRHVCCKIKCDLCEFVLHNLNQQSEVQNKFYPDMRKTNRYFSSEALLDIEFSPKCRQHWQHWHRSSYCYCLNLFNYSFIVRQLTCVSSTAGHGTAKLLQIFLMYSFSADWGQTDLCLCCVCWNPLHISLFIFIWPGVMLSPAWDE